MFVSKAVIFSPTGLLASSSICSWQENSKFYIKLHSTVLVTEIPIYKIELLLAILFIWLNSNHDIHITTSVVPVTVFQLQLQLTFFCF
jgi:hypothetical protein